MGRSRQKVTGEVVMISAAELGRLPLPDDEPKAIALERLLDGRTYLTLNQLDRVLRWKLITQYPRTAYRRTTLTNQMVRMVTRAAFDGALTASANDAEALDVETELRVSLLLTLPGVGLGVASAILALRFPKRFAVLDFRVWRQLFAQRKQAFSVADYKRYMREIRRLARELGWTARRVDVGLWERDRRMRP